LPFPPLHSIVEQNTTTALILEDDIDWDIRLKSQLQTFALASRIHLQPLAGGNPPLSARYRPQPGTTSTAEDLKSPAHRNAVSIHAAPPYDRPLVSPYGDDWDVLWLGHCGADFPAHPPALPRARGPGTGRPAQQSLLRATIPADATVPAPAHLKPHPFALRDRLAADFPPHTRVVHAAAGNTCTLAYAVSQRGARRLLQRFGLETFAAGWDLELGAWCDGLYAEGKKGAASGAAAGATGAPTCLTVQPPLFSHYWTEGKGSDIQAQGGGYLHKTGSQYVRLSVKANMAALVEGGEPVDQWPDE
jgi:hypothetical protein